MIMAFTDVMEKVWKHLIAAGMTKEGAAGTMGNLYAESGIIPARVEILCLQRLKEAGKIYTNATYTAFVDDGTISRAEFLNPLPGKQYGYGLCQWTSPGRKAGLYDLCRSRSVSIGDVDAQLDFLIHELKTSYQGVWKILTQTTEVLTASNRVLIDFEQPANTGTSIRELRYKYSKEIYDHFCSTAAVPTKKSETATPAKEEKMTEKKAIQTVIDIATEELGYLEKASGSNLDSKTGNAGYNNYTKYWKIYPAYQGQAWCACFVSWVFQEAFGLEMAKKLLKHWPFVYCPTLAGMTQNKTPKKGSIVLFYRNGTYAHTGIVIAISSTTITTIEGNTSAGSTVVPNGGGVHKKTYKRSELSANNKYFMPDYSIVTGTKTTMAKASTSAAAAPANDGSEEKRATQDAHGFDKSLAGSYKVTTALYIRDGAGANTPALGILPAGTIVQNYGYYSTAPGGRKWLYVQTTVSKIKYTGFCSILYLQKK